MADHVKGGYLRIVDESPPPYFYIKLKLEYEDEGPEIDKLQFKHAVTKALTEVFGQVGASETVDLLKLDPSGDALLRVPSGCSVRLLGSLALFGKYINRTCTFRVKQISSNLMSLSCNSREWVIPGE